MKILLLSGVFFLGAGCGMLWMRSALDGEHDRAAARLERVRRAGLERQLREQMAANDRLVAALREKE